MDRIYLLAQVFSCFSSLTALSLALRRREHFPLRMLLSFLLLVFLSLAGIFVGRESLFSFAFFDGMLFCLILLLAALLTDQHASGVLYTGIWALMTGEFMNLVWTAGVGHLLVRMDGSKSLLRELQSIGRSGNALSNRSALLFVGAWFLFDLLLAVFFHFYPARTLPVKQTFQIGPRQTVMSIVLAFLMELISLYVRFWYGDSRETEQSLLLLLASFCTIVIHYLSHTMFRSSAIQKEVLTLELLNRQMAEQYRLSQENIALINHKCHDLKHQVRALRKLSEDGRKKEYLDEIENSIRIYDAAMDTGSDVLDTILTDKSLLCSAKNIRINAVAYGAFFTDTAVTEIYTLFGNAIDNSIEEVQKIPEDAEIGRQIDLTIYARGALLSIEIRNSCATDLSGLSFEDNLPLTTKGNKDYHGFGMKSIRNIVKRYGGWMTIDLTDHVFSLEILLPLPESVSA